MALETAITDAYSDVIETTGLVGDEAANPQRVEMLILAALQAILDELQVQTAHLAQIESNTGP